MKTCNQCNIEKEDVKFTLSDHVRKDETQALRSHCNDCRAAGTRNWYVKHKEQAKASKQIYIEKNSEVVAERRWNYSERTREEARERANNHYHTHKRNGTSIIGWLIKKFKGVPCMDCNVVYPYHIMEFDHRPEEIKSFQISTKGAHVATPDSISMVMKEIDKCDFVCSNCHKERTYNRRK